MADETIPEENGTTLVPSKNHDARQGHALYNKGYFSMFLFYYIVEGSNNGLLSIFVPIFLIKSALPGIDEGFVLTLATFTMLPFTIKILWGIISDRFPIGRLGRRRPYISAFIILCGVSWLLLIAVLPFIQSLTMAVLILLGLLIETGAAFSDTALDGLIMDITPAEQLGRVEGGTWACYSIGGIMGGTLGIYLWSMIGSGIPVFVMFGCLSIVCGVLIWTIKEPAQAGHRFDLDMLKSLLKKKRYWNGYLFSLATHLPQNAISTLLALLLLIKLGILGSGSMGLMFLLDDDLTWYVLAFQLSAAGGIVTASLVLGRLADKHDRKKIFAGGLLVLLVVLPVVPFIVVDLPSALLVAFLVGLVLGCMSTMTMTFVASITQENPAATSTHFSIFTSFMNAGSTIGLGIFAAITEALLESGVAALEVYAITFFIAPLLALVSVPFVKGLPARPRLARTELEGKP
ncbi:MAG: MFS transporter [Candidatus Lokiarchaeota archaeon]|nr:MFS transporter [Candidatus Lokiarchaeota archaeon]